MIVMGAAGMRSAVLPQVAYLSAARLQFAARLRIKARRTAYAIFGRRFTGGELVSDVQPALPLLTAAECEGRLLSVKHPRGTKRHSG